jgi:hypothetical protein
MTTLLTKNDLTENDRLLWATAAVDFINSIGISIIMADTSSATLNKSFLENVRISQGGLIVDMARVFPGDILHEAAHLAIIPQHFRALAVDDLDEVNRAMSAYLEANSEGLMSYPEDQLCRAILQSGETEATAWQYAAAQAMGLPDEWLFPSHAYDGTAKDILDSLRYRQYLGINGLQAAGWTVQRKHPYKQMPVPVYPELAFWLHPGMPACEPMHYSGISI